MHEYGGLKNLQFLKELVIKPLYYRQQLTDPVFQRVCCIGIAEATVDALIDDNYRPIPSFVSTVNQAHRSPGGSFHEATAIWTKTGFHYVFDWWKTLDPDNPFIYRYGDWLLDKNPVQFVNFRGF